MAPSKSQKPSGDRVKTDARDAVHLARLLRLDPAFLGVSDPPQLVLLVGLEVQGRYVVEAQRDVPAGHGVF